MSFPSERFGRLLVVFICHVNEVVTAAFGLEDVLLRRLVQLAGLGPSLVLSEEKALLVFVSSVARLKVLPRSLYYVRRAWAIVLEARCCMVGCLKDLRGSRLVLCQGDTLDWRFELLL